jgi:tellurite resistance protein
MFFVGTTQLTLTRGTGEFYCPQCEEMRTFKLKAIRQFLTIYFIPLIPLQVTKEFALCSACEQQFELDSLSTDRASYEVQRQRQAIEVVRKAIILVVAADDTVTDEELEVVGGFGRQYLQEDIAAEQILEEATYFHQFEVDAEAWLRRVATKLNDDEKQLLVQYAFLAAAADGDLSDTRTGLLSKLPQVLDMPESLFRQVIERAAEI